MPGLIFVTRGLELWNRENVAHLFDSPSIGFVADHGGCVHVGPAAGQCAAGDPDTLSQSASNLWRDRKSTRLNSSHGYISYAVFCLKKKKNRTQPYRTHTTEPS